ncbi:MAG: glycosyltransferase family 2 protein [Motilibacteraceae bacterium]
MSEAILPRPRIAVLVPCHNEESSVGQVVAGFRAALPGALVVVGDNASTDATAQVAREAGAVVVTEPRRGKGTMVRRLLAEVDADVYVLVDGDATYEAAAAPRLVALVVDEGHDMVVGARDAVPEEVRAYRRGHQLGNFVLTQIFRRLFLLPLTDTLTGYRAMSRRFVRSFPADSEGFEIEAELNAHAAVLGVPVAETRTTYLARGEGSASKLNTYRDGLRILRLNLRLARDARPVLSFSLLAAPWLLATALLLWAPVTEYFRTGLVARFPSLIAGVGTFLVALNVWAAGLVVERIQRARIDMIRLRYLQLPGPRTLVAPPTHPPVHRPPVHHPDGGRG